VHGRNPLSVYWYDEAAPRLDGGVPELLGRDPSLNGEDAPSLERPLRLCGADFSAAFLAPYGLDYLLPYFKERRAELRVVTHPRQTKTCFEKAELLGWDPLRIIKALYFERLSDGRLFAVVAPETGCFVDRARLAEALGVPQSELRKAVTLPAHMLVGTCSPFIAAGDAGSGGGRVAKILFDAQTLVEKRQEAEVDDFSFGTDHRMSIQLNYYHCYRLVRARYPDVVQEEDLLPLSFKEVVVRTKGRLKVAYDFQSLSYRIAKFINSNHGHGDVSISNDCVDELDVPDVLMSSAAKR
jgi:hypothetical protein